MKSNILEEMIKDYMRKNLKIEKTEKKYAFLAVGSLCHNDKIRTTLCGAQQQHPSAAMNKKETRCLH